MLYVQVERREYQTFGPMQCHEGKIVLPVDQKKDCLT